MGGRVRGKRQVLMALHAGGVIRESLINSDFPVTQGSTAIFNNLQLPKM